MDKLSKAKMKEYVSNILKVLPVGTILEGREKNIALYLLHQHPRKEEKIGCGLKDICVAGHSKNKHLQIIRIDGSRIDYSYRKCLYGEPKNLDIFRAACRSAVMADIRQFKDRALQGNPICLHRETILTEENSVVDHVKPKTFNVIVGNFISAHGYVVDEVKIGGDLSRVFLDKELSRQFREFHNKHAVLELVYKDANNKECR